MYSLHGQLQLDCAVCSHAGRLQPTIIGFYGTLEICEGNTRLFGKIFIKFG